MPTDLDVLASALVVNRAPDNTPEDDALDGAIQDMPDRQVRAVKHSNWNPDLNPTQLLGFEDPAEIVVFVGPKGSGKTIGAGHKVVRHCYENNNALALTIAPTQTTGYEGFGYEMETMILPQWQEGMGLEFTRWKMDPVTKDRHLWIGNRFGGWSKLMLKSIPHANMVEDRVKGPAPSMVYVEELTNCRGREYFQFAHAQLGRRKGIIGPQQFIATCNPEGPDHWVYNFLYEEYVVKSGGKTWPNDPERPGIMRDSSQSVYFVPFSENKHRLPAGYRERLEKLFRSDPTLWKRLIEGHWIAYPSGEAIFKNSFSEARHVVGNSKTKRGLVPHIGYPIVVGYDLGKVNSSIIFMQCIETAYGPYWTVFDEICYTGEQIPYKRVSKALLEKMAYWCRRMQYKFQFRHVSDNSAFNQFQPGKGSTDVLDIRQYTADAIKDNPERYDGLVEVRLRECPKPNNSVEDRVSIMHEALMDNMIMVSATCKWSRSFFLHLEREKDNQMVPTKGKWRHTFDAMTYPMYFRKYVATNGFKESRGGAVEIVKR